MRRKLWIFLLPVLAACVAAGCVSSPSPAPAPTVTPASPSATPAPIGGSDEAHIMFTYQLGEQSDMPGLQKAAPGKLFYILKVKVRSDKPVETSEDWFWLEYRANESDSVHASQASFPYIVYPTKILQNESDSAGGELVFELPATMAPGYPKPYYYKPLDEQHGTYKVYDRVNGTLGDVQGIPLK